MELHLARPLALAALLVPALLLVLARRWRRPASEATGTLEVWREVAAGASPGSAGRRVPPALWFLVAALTLGALALAGPRTGARPGRTWHLVVDVSPSMELPHPDGGSRGERARAAAEAWLAAERRPADRVEWTTRPAGGWAALDRAGVVWITDRAPDRGPARAGLFASGGGAVPGAVAVGAGQLLTWDGERLAAVAAPERAVRIDASVPDPIAALVRVWAGARGLTLDPGPELALRVSGPGGPGGPGEADLPVRAGRDGWAAEGPVSGSTDPALEPWLSAKETVLVARGPGRVEVAWSRIDEPEGDPDAFAVSWSRLLDEALALPQDVVSLEERRDAGAPVGRPPEAPAPTRDGALAYDALLALLAAGCAALALRA